VVNAKVRELATRMETQKMQEVVQHKNAERAHAGQASPRRQR